MDHVLECHVNRLEWQNAGLEGMKTKEEGMAEWRT